MKTIVAAAALAGLAGAACAQSPLVTGAPNNGGSPGWGLYFDLTALNSDLKVTALKTYFSTAAGGAVELRIYTRPGTFVGFTDSPAGWTELPGTGLGTSGGSSVLSSLIDIPDIELAAGAVTGVCIFTVQGSLRYNGTGSTAQPIYENADIRLFGGTSKSTPFAVGGSTFTPRVFAGELYYEVSGCYADCDTSTGIGTLDIFDFLCFQNRFAASAPYACDCDTATGPAVCDIFDFLCFQNAFAAGCP